MRLALPILLLTTGAALAQSQPAPGKPYVYDGPGLHDFSPPQSVITAGPAGQSVTLKPTTTAPKAEAPYMNDRAAAKLCSFDNPPPCNRPKPTKNVG